MRIGILGSGLMGGKLGTLFARAGHEVVFSYARSERKLMKLAREAGSKRARAHRAKPPSGRTPCCWLCIGHAWTTCWAKPAI